MSNSRLRIPPELYREVVQHISMRTVLFKLVTVSRLLNFEAERVLYYSVVIAMHPYRVLHPGEIHCTKFSHRERVGHHVQLAIFKDICGTTTQDYLIPTLLSLTNMKTLTLKFDHLTRQNPFHFYLPEKVPFHLDQLTVDEHQGEGGLIPFLESQGSLRKLSWAPRNAGSLLTFSLSPSVVPHLTTLTSGHPSVIKSILPGRNIRLLDCSSGSHILARQLRSETSFLSVQALILPPTNCKDLPAISKMFPNLQCLATHIVFLDTNGLAHFILFEHLNILRLIHNTMGLDVETHLQFASKLFATHNHITIVELSHRDGLWWRFQRGFENDKSLVSVGPVEELTA